MCSRVTSWFVDGFVAGPAPVTNGRVFVGVCDKMVSTPGGGRVNLDESVPRIRQVVLDCTDVRALAEFYRRLLGLGYRPGDEPPPAGEPDGRGSDWLVLRDPTGGANMAFQQVDELPRATWPDGAYPQQLHLDMTVTTSAELDVQHDRASALGADLLYDRSDDPAEPLRVYADPAGHPFCIFVARRPEAGGTSEPQVSSPITG